jgi:hypothetical protein
MCCGNSPPDRRRYATERTRIPIGVRAFFGFVIPAEAGISGDGATPARDASFRPRSRRRVSCSASAASSVSLATGQGVTNRPPTSIGRCRPPRCSAICRAGCAPRLCSTMPSSTPRPAPRTSGDAGALVLPRSRAGDDGWRARPRPCPARRCARCRRGLVRARV